MAAELRWSEETSPIRFLLVRHCETASNIKSVYAGRSDEGLTPSGRQQARALANEVAGLDIDSVYTSPLRRAVQTAQIICSVLGTTPIIEDSFAEFRLGIWEGMSENDVARNFPHEWETWKTKPAEMVLEGRETLQELLQRVLTGLEKISADSNISCALVVTHVAIIRILLLHSKQMDPNLHRTIQVPNGEVFAIEASSIFRHF